MTDLIPFKFINGQSARGVIALTSDPSPSTGRIGDIAFVFDGNSLEKIYPPKTEMGWGTPRSGRGASVIELTDAPTTEGEEGDYGIYATDDFVYLYGPKGDTTWPSDPVRLDSPKLLNGTTEPTGGDGFIGDWYIRKVGGTTAFLYGPKTISDGWGVPVELRGANAAPLDVVDVEEADLDGSDEFILTEDMMGKVIVVNTTSIATIKMPSGIERGWSVLILRLSAVATKIGVVSPATILFQNSGDDRIAKRYGMVSVHNFKAGNEWIVSEGTSA